MMFICEKRLRSIPPLNALARRETKRRLHQFAWLHRSPRVAESVKKLDRDAVGPVRGNIPSRL